MKKLIIFLIGLTTVFSLSAQRLNQRGEKMVSHISNKIDYNSGEPYYNHLSIPYDIYFYYDSNDEINKIKAIFPTRDTDSIVITKGKNGVIWKDYHKKDSEPTWRFTHKVFLDEQGRVSKVESKRNVPRPFEVWRRTYIYEDRENENKDVILDVEKKVVKQPLNKPEYGAELDDMFRRGYHIVPYDGGLITGGFQRSVKRGGYSIKPRFFTENYIIDPAFPNETNVEFYALLFFDKIGISSEENDDLLLLSRWIPIKGDYLPLEYCMYGVTWYRYTDCIYNRNGDLTNIHVYTKDTMPYWDGRLIENIEVEYVQ